MTEHKKKRIFYFDALRCLAILTVVILHAFSSNRWLIKPEYGIIPSFNWILTTFNIVCLRTGVDLFLILSGALSLGRDWTIKPFLSKRIPRIVLPFLFWGFTLSILMISLSYIFNMGYINSFNLESIVKFIIDSYLAKSPGFYPYWFFWMILGTYLIMPIFNKWVKHSDLSELEYFLVIWLITCIFDFTLGIDFPIKLTYFVSPIGLVVLGYYLRYTERNFLNNPHISILLITIPCIIMMIISYKLSSTSEIYVFDRYCIFTAIEVIGIVGLFKNFNKLKTAQIYENLKTKGKIVKTFDNLFRKLVGSFAKYSYGIYLTHATFIAIMVKLIPHSLMGYKSYVLVFILVGAFFTLALLSLLNRIPYINQMIGAK